MNELRNRIQKRISNNIIEKLHDGKNTYIDVAPRVGKSKIICDTINMLRSSSLHSKILITVPYTSIINSWKTEFQKWNVDAKNIDVVCQRSLDKYLANNDYEYIFSDEIHTLSEYQIEVLQEYLEVNTTRKLVGLTGSLSKETLSNLKDAFSIVKADSVSIEEAIEYGFIASFKIRCIGLSLDGKDKYIEAGSKKKKFKTTEQANYNFLEKQFKKFRGLAWYAENDSDKAKWNKMKMLYASKRANLLYTAKSKVALAKKLMLEHDRALCFTARTSVADTLAKDTSGVSYHSKSSSDTLQEFFDGKYNRLYVCEMTNMGITFPNLKVGIFHQLKSSEESAIQKIMRMCNFDDGKEAEIIILYYKNTVEESSWLPKALEGFSKERIAYE
jgi:superfamily II DNA or RNA helicase